MYSDCWLITLTEGFCSLISPELILSEILPCVHGLLGDTSQHVRGALALVITGLAPLVGKERFLYLFIQGQLNFYFQCFCSY